MKIHCSACGGPLPAGAKFCPPCLPLTAIAMPTPAPRKRQISILAIVLCTFGILWAVVYASDHASAAHRESARSAFTAGIQPNDGSLATPEAFQTPCGRADAASQTRLETVLSYGELRIHFRPGRAVDLRRDGLG
jgi:hypothetical protein